MKRQRDALDEASDRLLVVLMRCAHYVEDHVDDDPKAAELAREHRAARDEVVTTNLETADVLRGAGIDPDSALPRSVGGER